MKNLITFTLLLITSGYLSGQNIGIGTSNPLFLLHVNGNILSDHLYTEELRYKLPNQNSNLLGKTNDTEQFFIYGENNALYVNSIGNVGINRTNPTVKLDINGWVSSKEAITNGRFRTNLLNGKNLFTFLPASNAFWIGNGAISVEPDESITIHETTNDTVHLIENKLIIEGKMKVGNLGSNISLVKKVKVAEDLPNIDEDDHIFREYTVSGAMPGDIVILSLSIPLPTSVGFTGPYVSAPNTIRVKYFNENNVGFNTTPMSVYIAILRLN